MGSEEIQAQSYDDGAARHLLALSASSLITPCHTLQANSLVPHGTSSARSQKAASAQRKTDDPESALRRQALIARMQQVRQPPPRLL